jgi:DNA-binding MarR family transcriptional regulator
MMSDARSRLAADAWGSLLRVQAALVPELDRRLQEAGGPPLAWYDILLELSVAPDGRLRMIDLGDRVVLSRSRVSRLVDDLAEAGLVRREQNPADGRSAHAVLTARGKSVTRRSAPVYLQAIKEMFGGPLTDAELYTIKRALTRVLHAGNGHG